MVQLKLAMGEVKDQKSAIEAQNNIKNTWEDLLSKAKIEDRDAVLKYDYDDPVGFSDPNNPVVALCVFIYQMENFVYSELNRACRFKDPSKLKTLGPFAAAMDRIIMLA